MEITKKYIAGFLSIIILDQLSKFLIEKYLYNSQKPLIGNWFSLTYLQNTGGAWGIFGNHSWVFFILVPVLLFVLIYLLKDKTESYSKLGITLIIAGALSNYADRILRGYVVDFIDFKIWPIFNLADSFIVIGCILMITKSKPKGKNEL